MPTRPLRSQSRFPRFFTPALLAGIAAALLFGVPSPASAQNLVQNPGFETGDFTHWTTTPAPSGSDFGVDTGIAHSGIYGAYFGAVGAGMDTISQSLPTTPGASYSVSFWLTSDPGTPAHFQASWNGSVIFNTANAGAFPYTEETFSLAATGPSTVLALAGLDVPAFFFLDDVSVTANSLPAAFWLGEHGDGFWISPNWASDAAGTPTASKPDATTDVTFSASGATHQNTVPGADFTIKSLTINDPAPVTISGNTLTVAGVAGTTGITVNPGAGAFTINSNLVLAGASQKVTVNSKAGMFSNGSIGGTVGLEKAGFGSLTLSGNNTYTGGTLVDAGVLVVNNAHALGTGGVTVRGGLLMADPQPINVSGNYIQSAGGSLLLHIGGVSASRHDFLSVSGRATLAGTLLLESVSGFQLTLGEQIPLILAQGGVTGRFALVDSDVFPAGTIAHPELIYRGGSVLLSLEQGSFKPVAKTRNQKAVAADLDRLDPSSKVIAFLDAQPLGNLPNEFGLIAPSDLSSLFEISFSAENIQQSNIEDRLADARNGATGFTSALSISDSKATVNDEKSVIEGKEKNVLQPSPENRWGVFISGNGDFVSVDGDPNAKGYDFTTGGVTLGIDYRVCKNFVLGAAFDYAHTWTALSGNGSIDVDSGRGGVYATVFDGGLYLDAYAGGGYNSYETQRAALRGNARGNGSGGEFDTFLGGGYEMHRGGLTFGPIASAQYTNVSIARFTETGSLAPLTIASQNQSSFRTDLGLKLSYAWKCGHVIITPQARASWQHEFEYSALPIDASFASGGGDIFKVYGPAIARDRAVLESGVRVQWNPAMATYLYYDGNVSPSYSSHSVNGGLELAF